MNARFVPTRVLNNLLRPKCFTRTIKRTLATSNELSHDYAYLSSGLLCDHFVATRRTTDALRNQSKAMFEKNIAITVKYNKKSLHAYIGSNAHNRNQSLLVRTDQGDLALCLHHSANIFVAYFAKLFHQMTTCLCAPPNSCHCYGKPSRHT